MYPQKMSLHRFRAYLRLMRMQRHRQLNHRERRRILKLEKFLLSRYQWYQSFNTSFHDNSWFANDYSLFIKLILGNELLCRQLCFEYNVYLGLVPYRAVPYRPRNLFSSLQTPVKAGIVLRI